MKSKKKSRLLFEKVFCAASYTLIGVFFLSLYMWMTMGFEDLYQKAAYLNASLAENLVATFKYIPRLGEFYQKATIVHMDAQVSSFTDVIFRVLIAIAAVAFIYLTTYLILARRPKLKYKDVLIFLLVFIFLVIGPFRDVLMDHFATVNNYLFAILAFVALLLLFRLKSNFKHPLALFGVLLLGFIVGISTEITPLVIIFIVVGIAAYFVFKKRLKIKDVILKHRTQLIAVVGIICGLLFFYIGAGISTRVDGAYREVYDYVSIFSTIRDPLLILRLIEHIDYNFRYLTYVIPGILIFITTEYYFLKSRINAKKTFLNIQIYCLAFVILYVLATSQIKLLDDLYFRFMLPVFVVMSISTLIFVNHLIELIKPTQKTLCIVTVVAATIVMVATIDLNFALIRFHRKVAPDISKVELVPGIIDATTPTHNPVKEVGEVIFDSPTTIYMSPSPIFQFKQGSPYVWQ